MPTVNMILRRHGHHAQVSGYDRISEHIPAHLIQRVDAVSAWQRLALGLLRPLHSGSGSLWYGRAGLVTEIAAAWQWLRGSNQIFHFVYGENSFRCLGYLKALRRNYVVCTYHTPPQPSRLRSPCPGCQILPTHEARDRIRGNHSGAGVSAFLWAIEREPEMRIERCGSVCRLPRHAAGCVPPKGRHSQQFVAGSHGVWTAHHHHRPPGRKRLRG